MNWTKVKDRHPKEQTKFNPPYISCIVFSCNPNFPIGGLIETCRWDVKNNCWLDSDIQNNWFLQLPYEITHFCDDAKKPFETQTTTKQHLQALIKAIEESHGYGFSDILEKYIKENEL